MGRFVRCAQGVVVEILEADVLPEFHPDLEWIDVTGQNPPPDVGWTQAAGIFAAPHPAQMAAIITAKQAEIRDGADAALAALAVEYGAMERQTWDQQYAEAEEMRTNQDAPAPLVRAIAAARGMDAGALAARIRANRDAWVAISGHVVGKRLAYQDALDAAAALPEESAARAAIAAIVPVYTLQG